MRPKRRVFFRISLFQRYLRNTTAFQPFVVVSGVLLFYGYVTSWADEPNGSHIYQARCAACHGVNGEGVSDKYAEPLAGDKSISELKKIIEETMPEDQPGSCVREEAAAVAGYVFDSFYSPVARARNHPHHVDYSRLTVTQYQNAIADLLSSFHQQRATLPQRGLSAIYTNNDDKIEDRVTVRRIDPMIDFNFHQASPVPDKFPSKAFAIIWSGSLYAPETGNYDFHVETSNGIRLWVNDPEKAAVEEVVVSKDIDGWRVTVFLLQGRWYFFKVMLSKKELDKTTAIRVKWKRPFGAEEIIPTRYFAPNEVPKTYIVETPFPPDARITGYERGTDVSPEWATATTQAAVEIADKLATDLDHFVGGTAENRKELVREFCANLVGRAFRRPLSEDERAFFVDRQLQAEANIRNGVKRVALLALKSPRFLDRETANDGWDDFDTASWLSFGLWDSIPDQPLLDAAGKGNLRSRDQMSNQVVRMLGDSRTHVKVRDFLHHWLNLDRIQQISKDKAKFPDYSDSIIADLRTSLDMSLEDAVWAEERRSDFRRLLLDDTVYLNGPLAKFYHVTLPGDANFQRVRVNTEAHAGILTHPYLMAGFAHEQNTSPIHRGVLLARNVLGRTLKPPQNAVALDPGSSRPGLTMRKRVEQQTSPESCMACHRIINNLGFAFENFDAVGRYQQSDLGQRIDSNGLYVSKSGKTAVFHDAKELSVFVANSIDAQEAFLEQMFRFFTKNPIQVFGSEELPKLHNSFVKHDFGIRAAVSDVMVQSSLAMHQFEAAASSDSTNDGAPSTRK
jgi:hypothetical protein